MAHAPTTLILLAHGSRSPETFGEMRELAARLTQDRPGLDVQGAFLSLTAPDLDQAVAEAIGRGSREIRILPLFLFSGKHVLGDIPERVEALRSMHPGVLLSLLDPIGRHPGFAAFLLEAAG